MVIHPVIIIFDIKYFECTSIAHMYLQNRIYYPLEHYP